MNIDDLQIVKAEGSFLQDASSNVYTDLCMGYGSVALGHSYKPVSDALIAQTELYSSPGFIDTDAYDSSKAIIEKFFYNDYQLHGYYPAGAVAIEFSLRFAMNVTGKTGIISFKNNMHGKTIATSQLGFVSELCDLPGVTLLPFPGDDFDAVLRQFKVAINSNTVSCVTIEPIQMSGGGYTGPVEFFNELLSYARENNVIVIFDEMLTGCYRTGTRFFYEQLNIQPDVVIAGKALGNGFPVSAVMMEKKYMVNRNMKPGGTYFNHPLMCVAVSQTLSELMRIDFCTKIKKIEKIITKTFAGCKIRGAGAMWTIELDSASSVNKAIKNIFRERIILSYYDRYIRLLPAYLMDLDDLIRVCEIIKKNI